MTIRYIKRGKSAAQKADADSQVEATVRGLLADIQDRGEAAVRELSQKFDSWNPDSFKLSAQQIADIVASVPEQAISDIKFAQEQIRNFAMAQRSALRDIEVETMPGVVLGHKNIPANRVGCYVPGGRYPMVASAHMERGDRQSGRRQRGHRLHASDQRRAAGRHNCRDPFWRRR